MRRFLRIWGAHDLASSIIITYSPQLKTSLGLTSVTKKEIKLNPLLGGSNIALFDEVLCHELAHIAVYELYGPDAQPHGREWSELMRKAGYEPNIRMQMGAQFEKADSKSFEHVCPVCQSVRFARRRMSNWRCKSCIDAGLGGKLMVREITPQ